MMIKSGCIELNFFIRQAIERTQKWKASLYFAERYYCSEECTAVYLYGHRLRPLEKAFFCAKIGPEQRHCAEQYHSIALEPGRISCDGLAYRSLRFRPFDCENPLYCLALANYRTSIMSGISEGFRKKLPTKSRSIENFFSCNVSV